METIGKDIFLSCSRHFGAKLYFSIHTHEWVPRGGPFVELLIFNAYKQWFEYANRWQLTWWSTGENFSFWIEFDEFLEQKNDKYGSIFVRKDVSEIRKINFKLSKTVSETHIWTAHVHVIECSSWKNILKNRVCKKSSRFCSFWVVIIKSFDKQLKKSRIDWQTSQI